MAEEVLENPELWNAYWDGRTAPARERLILQYVPLVKYVVGRLAISLPHFLTSEDIISYGVVGLIDAIERYEAGRNVKFSTYAIARIRGAIIDELRALDWVPRQVRKQAREIEQTMSRLDQELGRPATEKELAGSLNITVDKLQQALYDSSATTISLNRMVDADAMDRSAQVMPELADDKATDPLDYTERMELSHVLARSISQLTQREQQVLSLYYTDELNLREIGAVLQVSESRVCQLHTKAVMRLRGLLKEAISDNDADDGEEEESEAPRRVAAPATRKTAAPRGLAAAQAGTGTDGVRDGVAELGPSGETVVAPSQRVADERPRAARPAIQRALPGSLGRLVAEVG
ncbi:MAG: FliA/WhiG family RNA polymerase sigma factor [Chloroflexi bacterium]|nr:FliA/WhiG family RNA polymerase sigma factor [Chloroflexota bacterium]